MKKTIIAGAASLALAAMPMAGVFAAVTGPASVTDQFSVGVKGTCQLGTDNGGSVTTGKNYSVTDQVPGTEITFGGQSTVIDVNCNNTSGYKITPNFTGLTANDEKDEITFSDGAEAGKGSGKWSAAYTKNAGSDKSYFTNHTAINSDKGTMTDYYTVTYKVALSDDQAAGTYTGSAEYQLSENS